MPFDPARAKALFLDALERPDPADRTGFLDRECGEDADLRQRVDQLLAAYDHPAAALELPQTTDPTHLTSPSIDPWPTRAYQVERTGSFAQEPASPDLIGSIIAGRYKLRQEIGEGGMGSVYLAEQLQPVKRQVALKLIKAGMDTRTVLARFDSERQALALMDHPHIAKVLDAGTTEQGRPFFVMELVKGIPLTEYCDRHQLDLPTRLAIFRQICSAMQHAHQKGIIHRDLKPTNILVESHDGKPVPKVIDFGLAKATSGMQLSEHSMFTAFGSVTGTPLYMAPEQATFNALDVDTRADIYALGVILYELLTGSTPIQRGTLQRAGLDEMLRVIREDEPPTPSSRISTSEGLPSLAANRHVEPGRLSRMVRGELDWIVMKALAKERERRYDSAIGLANDVERYLLHEPVTAGPPGAAYRMRKFVRRNRGRVAAAALVLLALVLGMVGTTLGLIEARRQQARAIDEAALKDRALRAEADQRKRAERRLAQIEKANVILGSIFKDLDPRNDENGDKPLAILLGERLDQATAQIEGEAIGDPLAVARMQMILGESQLHLGFPEKAIGLFTRCRVTLTSHLGPDHIETLGSMSSLATSYEAAGQIDRAVPLYEETLRLVRTKLRPDDLVTLNCVRNLAGVYRRTGQVDRALAMLEDSLKITRAKFGPDALPNLSRMNDLALCYGSTGQVERSATLLEETLKMSRAQLKPDHPDVLACIANLADAYRAIGKFERSISLYEEGLVLMRAKLGPDHTTTLSCMNNLALCYRAAGQPDRSLPLLEETLRVLKLKLRPDHPNTLKSLVNLAEGYRIAGKFDRIPPILEELLTIQRSKLGTDHADTMTSMAYLAEGYVLAGQLDRSEGLFRELVAIRRRQRGSESPEYAVALASLGLVLSRQEKWTDAEPICREALAIRQAREPDAWTTFHTKSLLGGTLLGQRKYDDAGPLLLDGYKGIVARRDNLPPFARIRAVEALDRLIAFGEATGKSDEVKAWKAERAKLTTDAPKSP